MNFEEILKSLNLKEEIFIVGERRLPKSLPKLRGDSEILYDVDLEKLRKGTVDNEKGKISGNNFIESIKRSIKSSQDLTILLKTLFPGERVDKKSISLLYDIITGLNENSEYLVPVIPKFWNTYKKNMTPGDFATEKTHQIETYERTKRKTWADGIRKLNVSTCFTRTCFIFDYYIEPLKIRIELDGAQHDDFPQVYIDESSDRYFSDVYGIKTLRYSSFSSRNPNRQFMDNSVRALIKELYLRITGPDLKPYRSLADDTSLSIIYSTLWKGHESIYYVDDLFLDPNMRIGELKAPQFLIYEKEQHSEGYPMTSPAEDQVEIKCSGNLESRCTTTSALEEP